MLTYETAKKLKDWGFPQEGTSSIICSHGIMRIFPPDECDCNPNEVGVYSPTLSELIKSCGDKFGCLNRTQEQGMYFCSEVKGQGLDSYLLNDPNTYFTPEEAVASLWVSLNKKDA